MSKKRMQISATLLGILLSAGTFASAYPVFAAQSEVSVENNVDIGNINISLEKHGLDEKGEKTDFDDAQVVVPGQVVDELVDIFNLANDAWVRMKVTFDDSTIDGNMLDDSLLNLGDDWVKCGDYYYYTKPVKHGEAAEFLKSVSIPAEWTEALSEKDQKINFTADAVQEKNFTPNFKSDDPWFGTVIEQSVTDAYTVPVTSNNPFSVAYEGGAAGLVKVGDDFFSNWGTLMPGDVVSGKVTISNKYAQSVKIYFRTDTIADDNLLQKLHLKIACDGQTLYDGSMAGEITNKVLLGDFAQGSSKDLTYTLTAVSYTHLTLPTTPYV